MKTPIHIHPASSDDHAASLLGALGYQVRLRPGGGRELYHPQLGNHVCASPALYTEYVAGLAAGRALNLLEGDS